MWRDLATVSISCMADVSIMSAIQDYSYIFGVALGVEYTRPKVGPPGPAGGASERAESQCDALGAAYGFTAGLHVLL